MPYRLYMTRPNLKKGLLFRLAPYYLNHLIRQPYRRDIPAIGYRVPRVLTRKRRRLTALYDAMYNLLLDSYAEITHSRLAAETGEMFFLLIELTRRIDEHLDQHLGNDTSLSLDDVLKAPLIQEQIGIFRSYLHLFGRADTIMGYLRDLFATHYNNYVRALEKASSTHQFDAVLAAAEVDTGIWLRCTMEAVALFNGHKPDAEALDNFYLFGMVGKFADDMVDLPRDIEKNDPNLLYALISQTPGEKDILLTALEAHERLRASWWNEHCPRTFMAYFEYIEHYYRQIISRKLRFACDLIMLPAIVGRDYDPERSQGRLRHDEIR
jgi:hypothetical protein